MSLLSDIIARKVREVASLPSYSVERADRRSFVGAVMSRHPSLIAEIKPVSPLGGRLLRKRDIPAVIETYNRHAQAMSVLSDTATFGGGFDLLSFVRGRTDLPLLAKDFILGERQIDAAAYHGADAVLLIASLLDPSTLRRLSLHAIGLGLDVLIELHTVDDVTNMTSLLSALTEAERSHVLVGINNRDLVTQTIDLTATERLSDLLSDVSDRPVISESGISRREDIQRLERHVQGLLIGSALLQSDDADLLLRTLFPSP
ncbi:MAG: indole-3-glycerol-phosphate synthase [Candidatus Peribacteraceae bacterium]|nr:indole-3-glycerol-phosphate synthase [Candidatus Peribacteraceae bacterium]